MALENPDIGIYFVSKSSEVTIRQLDSGTVMWLYCWCIVYLCNMSAAAAE